MELVTSEVIIDRVKRRFKPIDSNWEGDALDIIGEAMDSIKSMGVKLDRELAWKDMDVTANRADKPSLSSSIEFIIYEGYLLDKSNARDALNPEESESTEEVNEDAVREIEQLTIQYETLQAMIDRETDLTTSLELQAKQKEVLDEINEQAKRIVIDNQTTDYSDEYWQDHGKSIVTSFSSGTIKVYYRTYYLDKNGYPMIPDEQNYRMSVYYYFTAELIEQGYESKSYKLMDAMQLHEDYGYKAKNEISRMTVEDRQQFADMSVRMKFNPSLGKSNFRR